METNIIEEFINKYNFDKIVNANKYSELENENETLIRIIDLLYEKLYNKKCFYIPNKPLNFEGSMKYEDSLDKYKVSKKMKIFKLEEDLQSNK